MKKGTTIKEIADIADVGVIVGRFQTPYLHEGHMEIIQHVCNRHPRVFIFLGQSPLKCTRQDPLDFQSRRWMVEDAFPDVEVHRIDDVGDNTRWSRNLDKHINLLIGPSQKVVLYGSRDSFLRAYSGRFPTDELKASRQISATEIRRKTGIKAKRTQEWREGVCWAAENQWPKVYATVDMATYDKKGNRLLLGRKADELLWRFPGGFSDVNSDSFEADAVRELQEETHVVVKNMQYIGSTIVDDWRYRTQQDKIKTLFFGVTDYDDSQLKADDDLVETLWMPLPEMVQRHNQILVPNHRILWQMFDRWLRQIS